MPLASSALTAALMQIGELSSESAAEQAWTDAWWSYASGMTLLLGPASQGSSTAAFRGAISGAFAPTSSTTSFLSALEGAMKAGWSAATYTPPYTSSIPNPAPFVPSAISAIQAGLNSQQKVTGRDALASAIHSWTTGFQAVAPSPPSGPGNTPFS